ncbi:hypothetical protein [Ruminococcus sp.]|uniref:hypothetical protein n=1 Tax=Ruminococcus sp. TaxID=41978 RepID=UPI0025E50CE8|nr:hypothetical protein [Ruminococcus sp.]MBQ8966924.1 hypothetical protein [Ruminococcus sp.]
MMDIEKYIKDLPAELQEKARQCRDMRELNELIADNDIELSEDVLEAVSGGLFGCNVSSKGAETGYFCKVCHTRLMDNMSARNVMGGSPADNSGVSGKWCPLCLKYMTEYDTRTIQ